MLPTILTFTYNTIRRWLLLHFWDHFISLLPKFIPLHLSMLLVSHSMITYHLFTYHQFSSILLLLLLLFVLAATLVVVVHQYSMVIQFLFMYMPSPVLYCKFLNNNNNNNINNNNNNNVVYVKIYTYKEANLVK